MIFFLFKKVSYFCFNRAELLQKANDRYNNCRRRKKAAKYYIANNKYGNLSEGKKKQKENMEKKKNELKE